MCGPWYFAETLLVQESIEYLTCQSTTNPTHMQVKDVRTNGMHPHGPWSRCTSCTILPAYKGREQRVSVGGNFGKSWQEMLELLRIFP